MIKRFAASIVTFFSRSLPRRFRAPLRPLAQRIKKYISSDEGTVHRLGAGIARAESAGNTKEAIDLARALASLAPSAGNLSHVAVLYLKSGNQAGAATFMEYALDRDENCQVAHDVAAALVDAGWTPADFIDAFVTFSGMPLDSNDFKITRWDITRQARHWFAAVAQPPSAAPQGPRPLVNVLAPYPWWISTTLAIACVLISRGCRVNFLLFPHFHREKPGRDWEEKLFRRELAALAACDLHPDLRIVNLAAVPASPQDDEIADLAAHQALIDTAMHERTSRLDLEQGDHERQHAFRLARNRAILSHLVTYLREAERADTWVLNNGASLDWGAAFPLLQRYGDRIASLEFLPELGSTLITVNKPYSAYHTDGAWAAAAPHRLDAKRKTRVRDWMASVETPQYWDKSLFSYQTAAKQDAATTAQALGIDVSRPVALLTTNVTWDTVVIGRDTIFPSMQAWITDTIAFFKANPALQLVVRIHPAEALADSREGVLELIGDTARDASNIVLIGPEDRANTYALMDLAAFGLCYASTTGIEMAIRGKPVICCGPAHFMRRGFTLDPADSFEYFALLSRFAQTQEIPRLSEGELELSWLYADTYLSLRHPFPWRYGSLWQDFKEWPMKRVLSAEGRAQFGESFDIISGTVPTYDGLIGRISPPSTDSPAPAGSRCDAGTAPNVF